MVNSFGFLSAKGVGISLFDILNNVLDEVSDELEDGLHEINNPVKARIKLHPAKVRKFLLAVNRYNPIGMMVFDIVVKIDGSDMMSKHNR